MLRVEEKIEQTKTVLDDLNSQVNEILLKPPKALIFTETASVTAKLKFVVKS